eukprot:137501_1
MPMNGSAESSRSLRHRTVINSHTESEEPDVKNQLSRAVKSLDLFPKYQEAAGLVRTREGATVSAVSLLIIIALFCSEFLEFMQHNTREHVKVDTTIGQQIPINFDITFHHLPCAGATVDAMDVTGDQQVDVIKQVSKQRLDLNGNYLGEAEVFPGAMFLPPFIIILPNLNRNEGCRLKGTLHVNKVAGNFHIALGKSHSQGVRHVHHFSPSDIPKFNSSHTINHFAVGGDFPGVKYPLDGVVKILTHEGGGIYQYYLKIIPTVYQSVWGSMLQTNQYSVTDQFKPIPEMKVGESFVPQLPGVFFSYGFSNFMVEVTDETESFTQFVVQLCAIVGGVITITGIVDSIIFHAGRVQRKRQDSSKMGNIKR